MPTYDNQPRENWMDGLNSMDRWNRKHLLALFAVLDVPATYLDVGCGNGKMVNIARQLGVDAYGVDQLVEPDWPPYFTHKNLVDYYELPDGKKADMITCIEVAEHIHESAHATLCDTLCNNLALGENKFLVFTAARPGQGGTGHIACRPAEYWAEQFILRGLTANDSVTMNMALVWGRINSPLNYFFDNVMVFNKGSIAWS